MKPSKCFRSLNWIITIKTEIKSIYPQSVVSAITHSVTSVRIGQQIKITQLTNSTQNLNDSVDKKFQRGCSTQ